MVETTGPQWRIVSLFFVLWVEQAHVWMWVTVWWSKRSKGSLAFYFHQRQSDTWQRLGALKNTWTISDIVINVILKKPKAEIHLALWLNVMQNQRDADPGVSESSLVSTRCCLSTGQLRWSCVCVSVHVANPCRRHPPTRPDPTPPRPLLLCQVSAQQRGLPAMSLSLSVLTHFSGW